MNPDAPPTAVRRPLRFRALTAGATLLLLVWGCSSSQEEGRVPAPRPDDGRRSLFVEGCPVPGKARAARIDRADLGMWGPQALGGRGDFLLMNDRAAFIVTGPGSVDAYWHYGGILVDAVGIRGCEQAGPERYEEFIPLVVRLDLLDLLVRQDLSGIIVRGFRGERAEVLNDGADGGDAVVRVYGTDDTFWLIEYTLIMAARTIGMPKVPSRPMGLEMVVDYVLPPDSEVLQVSVGYRNLTDRPQPVVPAAAHLFGPTHQMTHYRAAGVSAAGYGLDAGVPWITAVSEEADGAVSFAMENAVPATADISGVRAVLDLKHALAPVRLGAAGREGDTAWVDYLVGVGGTDGNSAERPLLDRLKRPFPWAEARLFPLEGSCRDAASGEPLPGADVTVETRDLDGAWRPLHTFRSDAAGVFRGAVSDLGDTGREYRVTGRLEGRRAPEPVPFTLPGAVPAAVLDFPTPGVLAYRVRDGQGRFLPARITLWQDGRQTRRIYTAEGFGEAVVPAGEYDASVTRGYEYETFEGRLSIRAGASEILDVRLERVVDASGFLSVDAHMHSARSPDSRVPIPERIRNAAGEGLEVAVSTDHEFVGSWQGGIDETRLGDWIATVTGLELTAAVPEHINLYGLDPRYDLDARGGYVRWYNERGILDIRELYAASRERGARAICLNHPHYLNLIRYDRLTGAPLLDDPTVLGLPPGAALWDWDLDAIEVMNGHQNPFAAAGGTGHFDNWMSFHNHGHRVTGLAVSDIHGTDFAGHPRTYLASPTDEPARMRLDDFVDALVGGRALMSTGAFARVEAAGGAGMGDLVTRTGGAVDLWLRIEAIPEIDVTHFVVFANCDEAFRLPATDPHGRVKYDGTLAVPVPEDAHVVVAGFGSNRHPRGLASFNPRGVPRFLTNPIFVDADGNGRFDPPGGKACTYSIEAP